MNYIGSKYSLIDFLTETISTIAGTDTNKVFADLFAGTGIVGKTFKEKGYRVLSNDIQYYSYVINKHYIENNASIKFSRLRELGIEDICVSTGLNIDLLDFLDVKVLKFKNTYTLNSYNNGTGY